MRKYLYSIDPQSACTFRMTLRDFYIRGIKTIHALPSPVYMGICADSEISAITIMPSTLDAMDSRLLGDLDELSIREAETMSLSEGVSILGDY